LFISDVGPTLDYSKGTYSRIGEELKLRLSLDSSIEDPPRPDEGAVLGREFIETKHLYSDTWRIVDEDGVKFLASVDDLAQGRDNGRWLRSVDPIAFTKFFPSGGPFIMQMNPQLETQVSTEQPATRPESKSEGSDKTQTESHGAIQ